MTRDNPESRSLTVLATAASVDVNDGDDGWVLRLGQAAGPDEDAPPCAAAAAAAAAERIRAYYPEWLWNWMTTSGALSLATFEGDVSWWWYAPISEKSCIRSDLIQALYALTLLREVLARHPEIARIDWHGDDPALAAAAVHVAELEGRVLSTTLGRAHHGVGRLVLRRAVYAVYAALRWIVLKAFAIPGDAAIPAGADIVFFTRFPRAWDTDGAWRERMYGTLPRFLAARGNEVVYAAAAFGPLRRVLREGPRWRRRFHALGIAHLEARLGLVELLRCHVTPRLFLAYARLRRAQRGSPVRFEGVDVSELLWREIAASVFSTEIPANRATARSLAGLLARLERCRAVFTAFEYQPPERAVAVAAHSAGVRIVAMQAALYNGNQMGWNLYPPELERASAAGGSHHVPDLVCAYGELPRRVFSASLGSDRVALIGGLRYGSPAPAAPSRPDARPVAAVLTSGIEGEALALVQTAFEVAAAMAPPVELAFKFHPLVPLYDEVRALADRHPGVSWRIAKGSVPELLPQVAFTICGATSAAMESVVHGRMPLVFRPIGRLAPNPMLHVPDAAFLWSTRAELANAIRSCLARDERYERRVAAWPHGIAEHLDRIEGFTDERVRDFLVETGVLSPRSGASPFFSVVIPAFDAERHLGQALTSVQRQTFPDFECIVIDDGSSDGTGTVATSFEHDPRFRSMRIAHGGAPGRARNHGIRAATGEYVAFLDADDLWAPDKLEHYFDHIRTTGAPIVFSNGYAVDQDGRRIGELLSRRMKRRIPVRDPFLTMTNPVPDSSAVLRRDLALATPLVEDTTIRGVEDYLLWLTLNARYPLDYLPEPLLLYRHHAGQISRDYGLQLRKSEQILREPTVAETYGRSSVETGLALLELRQRYARAGIRAALPAAWKLARMLVTPAGSTLLYYVRFGLIQRGKTRVRTRVLAGRR